MPVTPFHLGPGLAAKAVLGRHMSLTVFGLSQVAMDVEPVVRILRGDFIVHGFTHTYLGATLVGALAVAVGGPVRRHLLARWLPDLGARPAVAASEPAPLTWRAAAIGAFGGTYSHVLLDSVMHADLVPLAPFADGNALLGAVSLVTLHVACVVSGLLGALGLGVAIFRSGSARFRARL
jgi:hypothetical protein